MDKTRGLLQRAIAAHQSGRFKEAARLYDQVLRRRPTDPDALHFLGVLRHNTGDSAEAIRLVRRSLAVAADNASAWLNLGNILLETDEIAEAAVAYRAAADRDPAMADAWYNLGICLRKAADPHAALAALDRAIELRAAHAPSRYQRGIACRESGSFEQAEADFREALRLQPDYFEVYESLGMLLYRVGRFGDAASLYREWLVRQPDNPLARHMLAAMSGDDVPARASDRYVTETFDRFAETFDQNLLNLDYQAPRLVVAALTSLARGQRLRAILDAGCGTGMCGPLLRPITECLVGVDLSPAMIEKARERGVYDELAVAELCRFMRGQAGAFDAVVAADTLVYFGDLSEPLRAAATCLRPDGLLVITLERLSEDETTQGFRIEPHGRYVHRPSFVQDMLAAAGFETMSVDDAVLRKERGEPVSGLIVIARCALTVR